MNDLVAMTAESGDSVLLPTYRDSLKVKVEEEAGRKQIIFTAYKFMRSICMYVAQMHVSKKHANMQVHMYANNYINIYFYGFKLMLSN